ncbi:hypothetical protein PG995_004354 [Apiospora arundinis]
MASQSFHLSSLPSTNAKESPKSPTTSECDLDRLSELSSNSEGCEVKPTNDLDRLSELIKSEEEYGSDGEDCELHIYESRVDTRGERVILRAGTKRDLSTATKKRSSQAALVVTRFYNQWSPQKAHRTELEVQSKYLVIALRNVVGDYSGVDFTSKTVCFVEPPRCLFHYRDDLQQYAEASDDNTLKDHMQLLLQYTQKVLSQETKTYDSFLSGRLLAPELEHSRLWILFKPGCFVYEKLDGIESISRLRSIEGEREKTGNTDRLVSWILFSERINLVRGKIGLTRHQVKISRYDGRRPIFYLSAVPLQFHPEEDRIKLDLLERGRRFISLSGMNHCYYDGTANVFKPHIPGNPNQIVRENVKSRIMLDPEQFSRSIAWAGTPQLILGIEAYDSVEEASRSLSLEEVMTCIPYLPGISLETRSWGNFHVPDITEVAYNDVAFEALVLDEQKKRLISSLVGHDSTNNSNVYDDLIQGKGRGLVFLLHGPPGVGKTYTAESIADYTRRPLLKITSAELSLGGSWIEERLSTLFSLAARWNAIILLDEADVFMQYRTPGNFQSNWLVSTLLRVLEYYQGILFLTTNRPETIDYAFKSRIHLSIPYPHYQQTPGGSYGRRLS